MSTHRHARARAGFGIFLVMASAVAWGTVGVATQALYRISATNPQSIGFFRIALALPALYAAGAFALRRRFLSVAARDLALIALLGAMTALYQLCFFSAIPHLGVAAASVVTLCSAPVMVAALSALLLRERPPARVVAALLGAVAGTALLVGSGPGGSAHGSAARGAALALSSGAGYAVVALCSRSLAARCHPLQTVSIGFTVAASLLLGYAAWNGLAVTYPLPGWAILAWLGLVPTALAYVLFAAGVRSVSATSASVATLLEPLTSTALAWLVLGERLGSAAGAGALLLGGAMLALARGRT
jgi:drug/metabolite transporter, DME family